ncbi:YaaL family protein [Priestia endophytica]|jgi:hypothetical protein|uniref:DUF2508 family protein n=2 Tax=Priestia endophytica TaxID=135735 RepID=A0AAX1Q512_9BACI|nr:YaaL family protein [Priestia endophytica]KAB2487344.1 DUF2508 family protein [Priestia endophytica]KYG29149.1 hypothetical protein AZF06_25050 [Priestia endophytica]MBG9811222.1 hypothetical protein [Priestia endophytica]MCM3541299.1 YaaL family protein [Priestia endophytica]RAS71528.1 hypothetical protein A4R27_26330 [Priestia endophytica]
MLFKRKGWLREEYNQKLLNELFQEKKERIYRSRLMEQSLDPTPEAVAHSKLSEIKYLYLLKEAKVRNLTIHFKK